MRNPSWWIPDSCANALAPHHALVGLDREAGQVAHHAAGGDDLLRRDPGGRSAIAPGASVERHHHFLERGVAGPLADPIDGHLDLSRAGPNRGQGIGGRQPEVVVAMDAHGRSAADRAHDAAHQRRELVGLRVADRVRHVDDAGARRDRLS